MKNFGAPWVRLFADVVKLALLSWKSPEHMWAEFDGWQPRGATQGAPRSPKGPQRAPKGPKGPQGGARILEEIFLRQSFARYAFAYVLVKDV